MANEEYNGKKQRIETSCQSDVQNWSQHKETARNGTP